MPVHGRSHVGDAARRRRHRPSENDVRRRKSRHGDDILRGSASFDFLAGDAGNDVLTGGGVAISSQAALASDRLVGGTGDDVLIDGETDTQAARDVFRGGTNADSANSDPGDLVSYASRRGALRIDLGRGRTSTEDRLRGLESIAGGHGDDRLAGDRDDNWLEGGPGDDVLHGRDGRDIPMGGTGDDRAYGDRGDDVVWGDAGLDQLFGGDGNDFVISREEHGDPTADNLDCGDGSDDVRSDSVDTLNGGCEAISTFSNGLHLGTQPAIDADSADFILRCSGGSGPQGCTGTITLRGPRRSTVRDDPLCHAERCQASPSIGAAQPYRNRRASSRHDSAGGYPARQPQPRGSRRIPPVHASAIADSQAARLSWCRVAWTLVGLAGAGRADQADKGRDLRHEIGRRTARNPAQKHPQALRSCSRASSAGWVRLRGGAPLPLKTGRRRARSAEASRRHRYALPSHQTSATQ